MSIMPKYAFTHGGTTQTLTAGEVHRLYVPHRSYQWVQRGLQAGAGSVLELVNAAEARLARGAKAAMAGSRNSPVRKQSIKPV